MLAVDDDEVFLTLVCGLLRQNGYVVIPAESGADALAEIRRWQGPIDLLLTDVAMTAMTGPELAQRAQDLIPGLIVVYMTGGQRSRAECGVPDSSILLRKPIPGAKLMDAIRAALASRSS